MVMLYYVISEVTAKGGEDFFGLVFSAKENIYKLTLN